MNRLEKEEKPEVKKLLSFFHVNKKEKEVISLAILKELVLHERPDLFTGNEERKIGEDAFSDWIEREFIEDPLYELKDNINPMVDLGVYPLIKKYIRGLKRWRTQVIVNRIIKKKKEGIKEGEKVENNQIEAFSLFEKFNNVPFPFTREMASVKKGKLKRRIIKFFRKGRGEKGIADYKVKGFFL